MWTLFKLFRLQSLFLRFFSIRFNRCLICSFYLLVHLLHKLLFFSWDFTGDRRYRIGHIKTTFRYYILFLIPAPFVQQIILWLNCQRYFGWRYFLVFSIRSLLCGVIFLPRFLLILLGFLLPPAQQETDNEADKKRVDDNQEIPKPVRLYSAEVPPRVGLPLNHPILEQERAARCVLPRLTHDNHLLA